jgi:hypothetical protein
MTRPMAQLRSFLRTGISRRKASCQPVVASSVESCRKPVSNLNDMLEKNSPMDFDLRYGRSRRTTESVGKEKEAEMLYPKSKNSAISLRYI